MGPARRRAPGTKLLRPHVPDRRWCRTHRRAHQRLALPCGIVTTACARCLDANPELPAAIEALRRVIADAYLTPLRHGPHGLVVTTCA